MTLSVIDNHDIAEGTRIVSGVPDSDFLVLAGIRVQAVGFGFGMDLTAGGHDVEVRGTVGGNYGIWLAQQWWAPANSVLVAEGGLVDGWNYGVAAMGDLLVENHGTIQGGSQGIEWLASDGRTLSIVNHGTISGSTGVGISADEWLDRETLGRAAVFTVTVENHGTIRGGDGFGQYAYEGGYGEDTVRNWGIIQGMVELGNGDDRFDNGAGASLVGSLETGGGHDTVSNAGAIEANVFLRDGDDRFDNLLGGRVAGALDTGAGNDSVTNLGFVGNTVALGAGDDRLDQGGTVGASIFGGDGHDTVVNQGLVGGDVRLGRGDDRLDNLGGTVSGSVLGEDGGDMLTNQGAIAGGVSLGEGDDRFDNLGGTVAGVIDMGGGGDLFRPGAGAETAEGGSGFDTLWF